ncbi:adenylate kinase-domain-containing protein [Chytridium lagenaria]|nr:adenylate kinase-domain-containing protein [Chytridium lagenaria]
MHLQHFIQQEMELEARDYFEKKHINQIMEVTFRSPLALTQKQSIMTGLTYTQPDDPLAFIEDCVQRLKKGEVLAGKSRIQWDHFIPPLAKEATSKRRESHRRIGYGGKKHHNVSAVPILPPVKGAFIMPDAKPLLKSNSIGKSNASQGLQQREPLPALAKAVATSSAAEPPIPVAPELNHPNIIFVLGGPGSGKGTQCARLAEEFNFAHLSTGDLLRAELEKGSEIGKQCGELMKEGKIVPMSIMIGLLKNEMQERMDTPGFLIDGFPRALDQAFEFEKVIGKCRTVLYFSCPLTILEERLLERGKTSGRADDNLETIKKRFKTFEEQSMPVVDYYTIDGRVIHISSTSSIDEVYEQTRGHFLTEEQKGMSGRIPLPPIAGRTMTAEAGRARNSEVTRTRTSEVARTRPSEVARIGTSEGVKTGISDTSRVGTAEVPSSRARTAKTPGAEMEAALDAVVEGRPKSRNSNAWKNIIFVLGGPGCGKGTQCVRLAKDFNLMHLSAGDLLRAEVASGSDRAKELDALMKEGKIVPMEITINLLQEAMDRDTNSSGFLIDGFPRQLDQAKAFESSVAPCRLVLFFDCPEDILEHRLLKRGETSGRADDNIVTIKKRFKTFVDTSMPVVEYFRKVGNSSTRRRLCRSTELPLGTYKALSIPIVHNNLIFVLGGPGSGKGTQCARIANDFNYAHISSGDLLRAELDKGSEIGKKCGDLNEGGEDCTVDGFPRAVDQAQLFESTISLPSRVLFFNCPLETLEARLLERGKTSGRADDNLDTIRKRFQTFQEQSLPVVEYYGDAVAKIESVGTVDDVYAQVKSVLGGKRPFEDENIVFVLGGPGSGKGTQCDRLVEKLHFAHLSTGDLLRDEVKKGTELGQELEAIMKEGKLIPLVENQCNLQTSNITMKDVTLRLLVSAMEERRGKHPGYLIDGFPRNMEQAIEFEKTIGRCRFVLFFDAPHDILTTRLLKRGETSGRADDNLESINKRLETFTEMSMPVIEHFEGDGGRVRRVEATGDVEDITEKTLECFKDIVRDDAV